MRTIAISLALFLGLNLLLIVADLYLWIFTSHTFLNENAVAIIVSILVVIGAVWWIYFEEYLYD